MKEIEFKESTNVIIDIGQSSIETYNLYKESLEGKQPTQKGFDTFVEYLIGRDKLTKQIAESVAEIDNYKPTLWQRIKNFLY